MPSKDRPPAEEARRKTIDVDYRRIAKHINADPGGYLLDTEDWARRDTFRRRIRAIHALLLSFLQAVNETIEDQQPRRLSQPLRKQLSSLAWAAEKTLLILEFGIPVPDEVEPWAENLEEGAALLFAELRRAQNTRNPWGVSGKTSVEELSRRAQLDFLCVATGTTLKEFHAEVRKSWVDDGLLPPDIEEGPENLEDNTQEIEKITTELAVCEKRIGNLTANLELTKKRLAGTQKGSEACDDNRRRKTSIETQLGALKQQRRDYKLFLSDYRQPGDRQSGVKTDVTVRGFLQGRHIKQGKMDAMRHFFRRRLTSDNLWLAPYIEELFPAKVLRPVQAGKTTRRPRPADEG